MRIRTINTCAVGKVARVGEVTSDHQIPCETSFLTSAVNLEPWPMLLMFRYPSRRSTHLAMQTLYYPYWGNVC